MAWLVFMVWVTLQANEWENVSNSLGKGAGISRKGALPTFWLLCVCQLLSRVRLCDPMDCSLPGSSVQGILQARVLEWGAISFRLGLL